MSNYLKIYCFFFSLFLLSCASNKPFYNDSVSNWQENKTVDSTEIKYSVFLVGDARCAYLNNPVLKILEAQLKRAGKESAVIFLGDNIHPRGLPDSTDKLWDIAEKSILAQLEVLKDYKGEVIFIPGNHDWANGRKEGLEYVKNQRKYIENYLDRKHVFLPEKGRPGPVEVHLTEDIVLIIIDSQWWFHENEKSYTGVEDEADLFIQIKDAVSRNRDKKIIFAAHHPLYSVGKHGGHFPLVINILPLLEIKKILYIPLPGFIYTGYRKIFGVNQDLSHPNYKSLREVLVETFKGHSDIIYVAGHEHNLQYVNKNSIHHVISGAAGLTTYVAKSKKTDFAQMQDGFAKLNFYDNGDIWLEFWVTHENQSQSAGIKDPVGKLAFRKKLFNKPIYVEKEQKKFLNQIDFSDSTVVVYPNGERYQTGKINKILMGSNYRKEWITPIEVPVFDFNKEKGGLKILKKGGGNQTKSLRLEDKNGKQWVLRSMEKDVSAVAIPEVVKINLALDIIDDQMSAYLPYAALSVPRLADAVEIYHTNPEVFYLTKDPRIGKYLDDISEGLFLFEERPAGNRKDVVSFGQSKNIIGSPDLLENIFEDPKYKVDQSFFLKSRFLDIFINDWDRHEDQWRWASFEKKGNIIYKPIPRDRDQTFFLNEGVIPWIASRKFAFRKNQGFDYDIKDMEGLIMQGIHLDRRFLNELSLDDWLSTAKKMQSQLTDKVIEKAIYDMPEEITEINGKEIISKLKSRRDKLYEFAKTYYSIIASKVDIVGTNKREYFLVERLNDQTTKVTVFTLNKKGKKEDIYYQRLFNSDETKEIRLFGLKGKDEFTVTGEVNKGIKVRIVGGKGNDKITDKSEVKGLSKKTFVYDTKVKNDIKLGHEARNLTSNNPDNNQYIYKAFNYNKLIPLAYFGFNADDGFMVGAGFRLTTYGFQKYPNASEQNLNLNYSFATNAFEVKYESTFTSAVYGLDLHLRLNLRDPKYIQNFFGFGNETEKTTDNKDYNRVRIGQIIVNPELSKTFNTYNTCFVGLSYQSFDVEETFARFITDFSQNQLSPDIFETHNYVGLNAGYKFDTRNNKVLTTRGILWETNGSYFYRLSDSAGNYAQLKSDLSFYLSFRKPYRTVLAFRIGGSTNSGDYEFFQASSLGGKFNLRGYRATRFAGDACFYQNSEIRIKLFQFSNYISKGQIGLIGFHDIGRVWLSGESSGIWHQSYGGGLWLSPYEVTVISATYEHSKENELFSIKFNYLF